jgi:Predicted membrane protein
MFFASLLFGISASLDALLVGIGYGIRGTRIKLWQNLVISLITLLGTCLSVGLGHRLVRLLPGVIGDYAGSLILILLGLYYIVKWIISFLRCDSGETASENPGHEMVSASVSIAFPCLKLTEVLVLSLTLSLNNLSAGLSASLAGLTLLPAAVSTLACSVLFLFAGNRLGRNPVLQLAGKGAEPISGGLLIGLGVMQFFL